MKKIFTAVSILCGSMGAFGQDTTSLRWVGVNENGEFNFFTSDTLDLTNYLSGYGTGQAVFMNNHDSLLYAIFDGGTGPDRNLYSFNPFTGTYTLVRDLGINYISSADISEDGQTLYVIEGNGGSGLGNISAIDIATGTETFLTTALGVSSSSSYGIEFNPTDSSLYVFEGSWDGDTRVQIIDLATLNNTNSVMIGWTTQIHGAKWTGTASQFIVTAGYGCDMLMTDATANNLVSFYSTCPYHTADLEEFKMLRAASNSFDICPNSDSVMISAIYPGTNIHWYRDTTLLPFTGDVIYVSAAGVYRALVEIEGTGNFMWSEPITVNNYAVPVVNITQAANDTLICPLETIVLTGASGGSLQWFRNGILIPGATSSTYSATMSGSYNQLKTNLSGCADSASAAYVIFDQAGCTTGINEMTNTSLNIYPNPVESNLVIESTEAVYAVTVFDVLGQPVYQASNIMGTKVNIDFSQMNTGSYVIRINTAAGTFVRNIQK